MSVKLLKEYVEELLTELSIDRKFVDHLRRTSGLGDGEFSKLTAGAQAIAAKWLSEAEHLSGRSLHPNQRAVVIRFVARRMPMLVRHFRGNVTAVEQTMYNLLNARFYSLKGER